MYILHKELFYQTYMTWSDRKRQYVADFLAKEYMVDREGARKALFGEEPGMDDKPVIEGPWGGRAR
jgi:hypothetical protein